MQLSVHACIFIWTCSSHCSLEDNSLQTYRDIRQEVSSSHPKDKIHCETHSTVGILLVVKYTVHKSFSYLDFPKPQCTILKFSVFSGRRLCSNWSYIQLNVILLWLLWTKWLHTFQSFCKGCHFQTTYASVSALGSCFLRSLKNLYMLPQRYSMCLTKCLTKLKFDQHQKKTEETFSWF